MPNEINVISSDLDGAQLSREKNKNPYFVHCDGKEDNEQIQDAIKHVGKVRLCIPSAAWTRIFGGRK